jgi:hypothetical protein
MRPVRPVTAGMTDDEPKPLCDACGKPIGGDYFTDDQACGTGDGPGFLLCGDDVCVLTRPKGLRARRKFYARQRERNEDRHSYTAETQVAFHIEMHTITEDEPFDLGGLLGLKTDDLAALPKSEVDKLIQDALANWVSNHVESGWSIDQ